MANYYSYEFVSPQSICSVVQEELKSYFDTGAVDTLLFPKWVEGCLRKLGNGTFQILDGIIFLEDFVATLPDDFKAVREAWLCTEQSGRVVPSANSQYFECTNNVLQVSSTKDCGCDSCDLDPTLIRTVFKENENTFMNVFKKQFMLKPGKVNAHKKTPLKYQNRFGGGVEYYEVHGNKLATNFRTGQIYLIYYSFQYDEDGYPMIPDNYRIGKFVEYYLKEKTMEQLTNQVTDESFNQIMQKYQMAAQRTNDAYVLAQIEMRKETIWDAQRQIINTLNANRIYELPIGSRRFNGSRRINAG